MNYIQKKGLNYTDCGLRKRFPAKRFEKALSIQNN